MRGHPLLQLVLIAFLFVAAGFPVWKLTRPPAPAAEVPATQVDSPPPSAATTALDLKIGFLPAPAEFRLSYLGKALLEGKGPRTDFTGKADLALPKDGADLALEVKWDPSGSSAQAPGHAAAHLTVQFPDGHTVEHTVWAETGGSTVDLVTLAP